MKSGKENHNRAVSVRARLLQLARMRQTEFQNVLSDFAIERLLYRLGASEYASRFVLKGAMLFKFWPSEGGRATWDLDLLGRGSSELNDIGAVFEQLCSSDEDDGIVYSLDSIRVERIRVADNYPGVRVRIEAHLAEARIPVQVDDP